MTPHCCGSLAHVSVGPELTRGWTLLSAPRVWAAQREHWVTQSADATADRDRQSASASAHRAILSCRCCLERRRQHRACHHPLYQLWEAHPHSTGTGHLPPPSVSCAWAYTGTCACAHSHMTYLQMLLSARPRQDLTPYPGCSPVLGTSPEPVPSSHQVTVGMTTVASHISSQFHLIYPLHLSYHTIRKKSPFFPQHWVSL